MEPRHRLFLDALGRLADRNEHVLIMPCADARQARAQAPDPDQPADSSSDASAPTERPAEAEVRLLRIEDSGRLILERPSGSAAAAWVHPRALVELRVYNGDTRWSAVARVREAFAFPIREHITVRAIRLDPPDQITSEQRRSHYRVDTSKLDLPSVIITLLSETKQPPAAKAQLMNLSGGGFGLLLDPRHQAARQVLRGRDYQCSIRVPVRDEPLSVHARLIHVYPQPGSKIYLGFACRHATTTAAEELTRVATELQREILRRRRKANLLRPPRRP
ncbi:MAG: PilZ domain-containing protein [Phycisphaeraceae bacterium]